MGIFKDNSEVYYRSDFDKKNKADIRTLVLEKNSTAPTVLILHPHPEYGGTMNNKVVYNAFHTFLKNGFFCLSF